MSHELREQLYSKRLTARKIATRWQRRFVGPSGGSSLPRNALSALVSSRSKEGWRGGSRNRRKAEAMLEAYDWTPQPSQACEHGNALPRKSAPPSGPSVDPFYSPTIFVPRRSRTSVWAQQAEVRKARMEGKKVNCRGLPHLRRLDSNEADVLAQRAQQTARKLIGPDGQLLLADLKAVSTCCSAQLQRSILAHLPYHVLLQLRKMDYGRWLQWLDACGSSSGTPMLFTGDIMNSSLTAADQRERVFWLRRPVPDADTASMSMSSSGADAHSQPQAAPPLNPAQERSVQIFGAHGLLNSPELYWRRALDTEEACHPRVEAVTPLSHVPWIPPKSHSANQRWMVPKSQKGRGFADSSGVPGIVMNRASFDRNLRVFSHGVLEGVLGNGAVLGGSAVMACLSRVSVDEEQAIHRYMMLRRLLYKKLRCHDGEDDAVTMRPLTGVQVSIAHILWMAGEKNPLEERFSSPESPFYSSDIDIYMCARTREAAAERMVEAMRQLMKNTEPHGRSTIVQTPNALTICGPWPVRHVQFIIHVSESVDELLSFADLDCTALAFDGTNVLAAPRALRALTTGYNFVPPRMLTQRRGSVQRVAKYCRRGFGSLVFELCKHCPRCDVEVDKTVWSALQQVEDLAQGTSKPPGAHEISKALRRCREGSTSEDMAAVGAAAAKVMNRMRRAGASLLPRGAGINAFVVEAYIHVLPYLVQSGLLNSPPLAVMSVPLTQADALEVLQWKRTTVNHWAQWGMVPRGPGRNAQCYQCSSPVPRTEPGSKSPEPGSTDASNTKPNSKCAAVCKECHGVNVEKRVFNVDLTGKTALVTGGRAKIGFEVAMKLLCAGAHVIVTTRFPYLAAKNFAVHAGPSLLRDQLHVYGVDFRHLRSLTDFCDHVVQYYSRVDILVNNAAQTVRRPPAYYRELFMQERDTVNEVFGLPEDEGEDDCDDSIAQLFAVRSWVKHVGSDPWADSPLSKDFVRASRAKSAEMGRRHGHAMMSLHVELTPKLAEETPASIATLVRMAETAVASSNSCLGAAEQGTNATMAALLSSALAMVPLLPSDQEAEEKRSELFPLGARDLHGEPLDLREKTSWTTQLGEVPLLELMEVLVVNTVAPFLLTSRLLPLLGKAAAADTPGGAFVINVTSPEGTFNPSKPKGTEHPHTNMGKAALNMLTRTIAEELGPQGIFTVAVDTGWISQMRPNPKVLPPLTVEDGAARILDPVSTGFEALQRGNLPVHGVLLQHFRVVEW